MPSEKLILFQWGVSSYFGWGVYGLNLLLAWAKRTDLLAASLQSINPALLDLDPLDHRLLAPALRRSAKVQAGLRALAGRRIVSPHLVLHTLNNGLKRARAAHDVDVISKPQVAVAFLDRTNLEATAVNSLAIYTFVVAGSTWNQQMLQEAGAPRVELVLQGVDTSHFHPAPQRGLFPGRFVVFSGGKLEYRKGQDLVLQAFRIFAKRHPDALLLTAWSSPWPQIARTLAANPDVVPPPFRADGTVDVPTWAGLNGISPHQVIDVGSVPNRAMPRIIREADVALFPNRAEGGTNLVAMECMASGIPTILSANTGHLDLIGDSRCIPLIQQTPVLGDAHRGWGNSSVEEIVAALQLAYRDREAAKRYAERGAAFLADLTWTAQMNTLGTLLTPLLH